MITKNYDLRYFVTGCAVSLLLLSILPANVAYASKRQAIEALYIPLADHYAALVAYERYRHKMKYADFRLTQMKNWDLLRAKFEQGNIDMAFVMSPLAMDMFHKKANFRWIGLMHRDGNALAINELLNAKVMLPKARSRRKPGIEVAEAIKHIAEKQKKAIEVAVPHLLSTHSVVLYQYLKQHGLTLSLLPNENTDVLAISVAPSESPVFIKANNSRSRAAAFEQSLPWADIVETGGYGTVAWYSKDVMPWPDGHVECIAIASDRALGEKLNAVQEVMKYIRKAGEDIELARQKGGKAMTDIVRNIQKHIPAHTSKAIVASLDHQLRVINYQNLAIDKEGLKMVMDLAVEGGILKQPVNIDKFADSKISHVK